MREIVDLRYTKGLRVRLMNVIHGHLTVTVRIIDLAPKAHTARWESYVSPLRAFKREDPVLSVQIVIITTVAHI
jgi:hypothetical protein